MQEKYPWEEATSSPSGYPVDVYRGGLQSSEGSFTSLYSGITIGNWGEANNGMSSGDKSVPDHLHVIWLSYSEDSFYEIDTPIDKKKMQTLFQTGYYLPSRTRSHPEPRKETYDQIIVGFAPGGMVVVWLAGSGRQVEIGRYQAKKIQIPPEQISALDYPLKNLFDAEYRKTILSNPNIVPPDKQEYLKTHPIPYGLWDTYREKYKWKIDFQLPEQGKSTEFIINYFNGETEDLFGEKLVESYTIPEEFQWDRVKTSIPTVIDCYWLTKENELYTGLIKFNELEIFQAFTELYKEDPAIVAELQIKINQAQDYAVVKLIGNGKEIYLSENDIEIYKVR